MKMKTKIIKPIFKSQRGRHNLFKWILEQFPENYRDLCYVEPYCGGANLLLLKDRSLTEAVGDSDASILSIYRGLRDEPKEFIKKLNRYKYCEDTFEKIKKKDFQQEDYLDRSIGEYILKNMSRSELGEVFSKSNSKDWKKMLGELADVSYRLQEVFIFNKNAIEIIEIFNATNCLVYCDPPFLHENKNSKKVYSSDMDTEDHIQLSHRLNSFKGKVIISGLTSPLYKRLYKDWNMIRSKVKKKDKKSEVIWKNF